MTHFATTDAAADWILDDLLPRIDRTSRAVMLDQADGERLEEAEGLLGGSWWHRLAATDPYASPVAYEPGSPLRRHRHA